MSYDEFSNSSFDLNHDGNIDCTEASYIENTIYGDDCDSMETDEDELCGGNVASRMSAHEACQVIEDEKPKEQNEEGLSDFIAAMVVVVIIVAIMAFIGLLS